MKKLYLPYKLKQLELKNRTIMAPLTRCRAGELRIPNDLMATYYEQRAQAGLIISEATVISPQGVGYLGTPGIYNEQQVEGWKKITNAVHQKEGKIFLQLWHCGRISNPDLLPNQELPVSASNIAPIGKVYTAQGMKDYVAPRPLEIPEIKSIVKEYGLAADRAIQAGFDGVEIHGANGYLIDQFLRDGSNHRTDQYGGSFENRARFLMEIIDEIKSKVPAEKIGLRLSLSGTFNSMSDSNPASLAKYLGQQLSPINLAYLHVVDALSGDIRHGATVVPNKIYREAYSGTLILCGEYDQDRAEGAVDNGVADLIAFGNLFISNPDLPTRFKLKAALNPLNSNSLYSPGPAGYIDYPFYKEF